jgi:hypothetical protein
VAPPRKQRRPAQRDSERAGPAPDKTLTLPRLLPWIAVLLAVVVYVGVLSYPFVYDDLGQIVGNSRLQSVEFLPQYFLQNVWSQPGRQITSNYYRPFFLVWLMINYQWFEWEPAGYHAAAIALHALVTLLVYGLAVRTLKDRLAAGFAALVFAVHPLHVASVAWVSGANEPEFALFFLAAMLCYPRWSGSRLPAAGSQPETSHSPRRTSPQLAVYSSDSRAAGSGLPIWFVWSLACYALALLSKETAIAART